MGLFWIDLVNSAKIMLCARGISRSMTLMGATLCVNTDKEKPSAYVRRRERVIITGREPTKSGCLEQTDVIIINESEDFLARSFKAAEMCPLISSKRPSMMYQRPSICILRSPGTNPRKGDSSVKDGFFVVDNGVVIDNQALSNREHDDNALCLQQSTIVLLKFFSFFL